MLVVDIETERVQIVQAVVDFADRGVLIGGSRDGSVEALQSAIDRGTLSRTSSGISRAGHPTVVPCLRIAIHC